MKIFTKISIQTLHTALMKNMPVGNDATPPPHMITGKTGESLAAAWLEKQGFHILEKNWRHKRFEVDIIASKENVLHFIEVKTKKSLHGGFPEEQVTLAKIRRLVNASIPYRCLYPGWNRIQFDVLAITLVADSNPGISGKDPDTALKVLPPAIDASQGVEYFFIEDVYT
jgi:putative endonuclease